MIIAFLSGCEETAPAPHTQSAISHACQIPAQQVNETTTNKQVSQKNAQNNRVQDEALAKIEQALAESPDDPGNYEKKAQRLAELQQFDEAYETAQQALQKHVAQQSETRHFVLEQITLDKLSVEVQLNMGSDERTPPEDGITRPLTFQVWTDGSTPRKLEEFDFEIGYFSGQPVTAAFGKTSPTSHDNYGVVDLDIEYSQLRMEALELVKELVDVDSITPNDAKQYLNVSVPGESKFTPIVMAADEEKTIVARVAYVNGKRDVQVLEIREDGWNFVGDRGQALTGQTGTFLKSAVQGPDGRLWVQVSYTPPSNSQLGFGGFLYMYEEGGWSQVSQLDNSNVSSDFGLLFLGSNDPVHGRSIYTIENGEISEYVWEFSQLNGTDWVVHPVQKLMREKPGHLLWNNQGKNAWYVVSNALEDKTLVEAYQIQADEISGPYALVTLDGKQRIWTADASLDGQIALLSKDIPPEGTNPEDKFEFEFNSPYQGTLIDVTNLTQPKVTEFPSPPKSDSSDSYYADHFLWSPTGELFCTDCGIYDVTVFVLRNSKWQEVAAVEQDPNDGDIFDPEMTFRTDGTPIITWEDFFPH